MRSIVGADVIGGAGDRNRSTGQSADDSDRTYQLTVMRVHADVDRTCVVGTGVHAVDQLGRVQESMAQVGISAQPLGLSQSSAVCVAEAPHLNRLGHCPSRQPVATRGIRGGVLLIAVTPP